jgi:hypothetical protein
MIPTLARPRMTVRDPNALLAGSAAYNLLIITAVCIVAVPEGEVKRITEYGVFLWTAAASIFAYFWLLVVYKFWMRLPMRRRGSLCSSCLYWWVWLICWTLSLGGCKRRAVASAKVNQLFTRCWRHCDIARGENVHAAVRSFVDVKGNYH